MTVLKHQNTITFQYISSLKISGLLHFLKFLGPSEKITIYRSWMMTLYVHQILKPDQMFPEHLRDNEGALPSPVCSCVRVKRKCSSLPRALNIKCADKLSFFSIFSQSKSFHCIQHIFHCSEYSRSHLVKSAKWNKVLHIQPFSISKTLTSERLIPTFENAKANFQIKLSA